MQAHKFRPWPGGSKGGVISIDCSHPDLEGEVVIISQSLDGREVNRVVCNSESCVPRM